MSSVSSITPSSSISRLTSSDTTTSRVPQKTLGQDDFLKLLAKQFQVQDPMKPMEDTTFIAQMAQFSALQETSGMAQSLTAMRSDQERATANSYLGHRVTLDDGNGGTIAGDVSAVDVTTSSPRLVVGGTAYSLSAVLRVEPGATSTSQSASTGAQ